jgi:hypothetical protein
LLDPLDVLDGILIDENRFAQFEGQSLETLERNGIDASEGSRATGLDPLGPHIGRGGRSIDSPPAAAY